MTDKVQNVISNPLGDMKRKIKEIRYVREFK